MKNKWLIILFMFFFGVILLSLLVAQQSQKAVAVAEKELAIIEQRENRIRPVYLPGQARQQPVLAGKPLAARSGITIINASTITAEEKNSNFPKVADKSANHINSQASQNIASTAEVAQDSLQTGITKTGKQPTPEKAREMNSSGIVLY
ncbi:MAG: hypothetical protein PHS66_07965 [Candidatus Omnitrophica bacterium]|nr:hypothetical protein [Candidatus Omnitrophota bacterium]